ncbi:MAG: hypothetical protein ACK505_06155 [Flavobacteriales bacterium]|jgi:hypothetical protein
MSASQQELSKITKQLSAELASKDKTKEQLWQEAFDRMLQIKSVSGVRVWFINDKGKRDAADILQTWDVPKIITPETFFSFKPLNRKERRAIIVKLVGPNYLKNRITKITRKP